MFVSIQGVTAASKSAAMPRIGRLGFRGYCTVRSDADFMRLALEQARAALAADEVPVGAVVVANGEVISRAHNSSIAMNDPSAHAEMLALRRAARSLGNYRLNDAVVYATLEPCAMCFGAMVHARIGRLVFGAMDPKSGVLGGGVDLRDAAIFNHRPRISPGVLEDECADCLRVFFDEKRAPRR